MERGTIYRPDSVGIKLHERQETSRAELYTSEDSLFGGRVLKLSHELLTLRADPQRLDTYFKYREKSFKKALLDTHQNITKLIKSGKREAVQSFFFDSLKRVDIDSFLSKTGYDYSDEQSLEYIQDELLVLLIKGDKRDASILKAEARKVFIAQELADIFTHNYLSGEHIEDEQLLLLLQKRKEWIEEKQKLLDERLRQDLPEIEKELILAAQNGLFPIDSTLVRERISAVQFYSVDELAAHLNEMWGDYDFKTHLIRISSSIPEKYTKGVIVHELFHALSGQSELLETNPYAPKDEQEEEKHRTVLRSGLSFTNFHEQSVDLDWLNEALTEQATIDLLHSGTGSYPVNRELLKLLVSKGVKRDLLYAAYFENHTNKTGHPTPALKALFNETNQQFGVGFLADLDRYISPDKNSKTKKARDSAMRLVIKQWAELGDAFPSFLKQEVAKRRALRKTADESDQVS